MDTIQLPPDFKEFIQLMNSEQVEYLLVGGYAVGFHGAPRFTSDIDIWVNANPINAAKLGRVLAQFGVREPEIVSGRFLKPKEVFRIGNPPLQIDLLTNVAGCEFADCYGRREAFERDGLAIQLISLADLKLKKRGRTRKRLRGPGEFKLML